LLDIANNLIRQSTDKKTIIGKSVTDLQREIESLATVDRMDMKKASEEFVTECNMSDRCLNTALQISRRTGWNSIPGIRNYFLRIHQPRCGWSDSKVEKIRNQTFAEPTEEYCLQLKAKADDLTQQVAKNKDEYINMLNRNIKVLEDLNYTIAELEIFKSEITNEFIILIQNEKQELINLGVEALNRKKTSYDDYVRTVNDIQTFINQLINENANLEIQTNNLADDIDENLESYDKLTSTYEKRNPVKTKKDLDLIILSNQEVINNQVKSIKTVFYIGILETLFLMMFTIFIFMKAITKLMS
jgi:hypothetical protein